MKRFRFIYYLPLIMALPSVLIGAIAMYSNNVQLTMWGQNIACLLIAGLISYFTLSKKSKINKGKTTDIPILISILLLFNKIPKNLLRFSFTGLLFGMFIISWFFLDKLPPVVHVEEILSLVANMGTVWLVLGIISLLILPLPFLLFPPREYRLASIGIGIYFTIILISTQFGNFPVILMGYGISPIIGYFIAITWLIQSKINYE